MEFANNGSIKVPVKLQTNFYWAPEHFGVFPSGEYLVVGLTGTIIRYGGDDGWASYWPSVSTPFTAVFAADGRLVKKIYEPEDEDARQRAEGRDPQYLMGQTGNEFGLCSTICG